MSWYLLIKFIHVFSAILAAGSSAGSSLWLRLASGTAHEEFALRTAKRLDDTLTKPGLIVLLITGLALATRWSFSLLWIRLGLGLLIAVLVLLFAVVTPAMRRLIRLAEEKRLGSSSGRRAGLWFQVGGGAAGLLIVVIVALMVAKPS